MSENVDFQFSFAPFTSYTPYTGEGGSDTLPFDGFVAAKLVNFTPYFTKAKDGQPGKPAVKVHLVVEDQDAAGSKLIADVLCGGKDKNGDDLGRQFIDLLTSSGTTLESIKENAQKGTSGSIKAICESIKGRIAYVEVAADRYEDRDMTKVANWITKERYEQAKTIGAHRKARRTVGVAPGTGVVRLGGGVNGQAPAPGAAAAAPAGALPSL